MPLKTSIGQLVVNHGLPAELRDYSRVLDKKGIEKLLRTIATDHPEKYRDAVQHLSNVGYKTAQMRGGFSFGLQHLRQSMAAKLFQEKAKKEVAKIRQDKTKTQEEKEKAIVDFLMSSGDQLTSDVLRESLAEGNPLAQQVLSGARGNPTNLRSLRAGDLLYVDHKNRPIPVPILRSYSQGLTPVEYYAGTFGARKGMISNKFCLYAQSKVLMADYTEKEIQHINVGDMVMGSDFSGNIRPVKVLNVFNNGKKECYKYTFRNNSRRSQSCFKELIATKDHKILATNLNVSTPSLLRLEEARDSKFTATAVNSEMCQFQTVEPAGLLDTYDIEVDHPDHMFVLANGLIVSNSTQQSGFLCLSAGTLVRMGDFSTKAIEQIKVGDVVLGANSEGFTFPVKVTATFDNGTRDLYRFRFRYGKSRTQFIEVIATEDHKALARRIRRNRRRPDPKLHKTVTTGQFRLGDFENRSVSFYSLVPPQGFMPTDGIHEPLAWLIGLLIGDGGLTTRHLGFSCGDEPLLEKVSKELRTHGFSVTRKGSSKYEFIIKDLVEIPHRLKKRLAELGLLGHKSPDKIMPEEVSRWNKASLAALIRGIMDSDGGIVVCKNDKLPQVKLGMTAESVVRGVQEILATRFGIYGQVSKGNTKGRSVGNGHPSVANYDIYVLCIADYGSICRFVDLIGFGCPYKEKGINTLLAEYVGADRENDFLFHYVDKTHIGDGQTYDIEVDHPDHLFVLANGAIVSNSKQLNQVSHRLIVSAVDRDKESEFLIGMPSSTDDPDNEGALLAADTGDYKRNTIITPKILASLKANGVDKILVRSPITGSHPNGGVYAKDVGVREKGTLPHIGEMTGIAAAQALSEPITQGMLSEKHKGGIAAGKRSGPVGFDAINQLIQAPAVFKGGASHAQNDGRVTNIREAPQGGYYVEIDNKSHYVGHGFDLKVKQGDEVEAGDVLSDGMPNPSEIVRHKGLGEGRRYFVNTYLQACKDSGIPAHRRNIELLARGLIDHVELDTEYDDYVPGDTMLYSRLEHLWQPREGHRVVPVQSAKGMYLEKPVLHYSIGTPVKASVIKTLNDYGVKTVAVHKDPAPFQPTQIRGLENLAHDPDWMTRFLGSYLKKNFLRGVHEGSVSDEQGTSYVPSLARSIEFGMKEPIKDYKIPGPLPTPPVPAKSILKQMEESTDEHAIKASSIFSKKIASSGDDTELPKLTVEYEAGTHRTIVDDDDDEDGYPLRQITYPVDSCRAAGYKNEQGDELVILKGTDSKGESGQFSVYLPDVFKTETKFYYQLSPFEKDQLFRQFADVLVDMPKEFKTKQEFLKALSKFKLNS